jgi:hypothetical protein
MLGYILFIKTIGIRLHPSAIKRSRLQIALRVELHYQVSLVVWRRRCAGQASGEATALRCNNTKEVGGHSPD